MRNGILLILVKSDVHTTAGSICYIPGHGTIAQADEMADGVERGGGVHDEAFASQSGMPVADDIPGSALSAQEAVVGMAGERPCGGLAVSTAEADWKPVAAGGQKLSPV